MRAQINSKPASGNGTVNRSKTNARQATHSKPVAGTSAATITSDERLRSFGINPKKFHKKEKYGTGTAKANPSKKPGAGGGNPAAGPATTSRNQKSRAQQRGAFVNREALDRMKAKMFANQKIE